MIGGVRRTLNTLRIGKQHRLLDLLGLQLIVFDPRPQVFERVPILRLYMPTNATQGPNNTAVPKSDDARCGLDVAAT